MECAMGPAAIPAPSRIFYFARSGELVFLQERMKADRKISEEFCASVAESTKPT
jgi:hypothetical protein